MRTAFVAYGVYLTVLLLSQDPTRWIGTTGNVPEFLKMLIPIAHLLSFTVLSFLTFAAGLPVPRWGMLLLLALYGGATEIVQSVIPHRTAEWMDWFQDLGGIAIGFVCLCLAVYLLRMLRGGKSLQIPGSS